MSGCTPGELGGEKRKTRVDPSALQYLVRGHNRGILREREEYDVGIAPRFPLVEEREETEREGLAAAVQGGGAGQGKYMLMKALCPTVRTKWNEE